MQTLVRCSRPLARRSTHSLPAPNPSSRPSPCDSTANLRHVTLRSPLSTATRASVPSSPTAAASSSSASPFSAATAVSDMLKLSKHRLSGLVAFTATAGFICRATPSEASSPEASKDNDKKFYRTLASVTLGTWLTSAAANTLNQMYERGTDALMQRTRGRPIPTGRIGMIPALLFAATTATAGLSLLYVDTNGTATALAAANLVLYAGVYTPMKRVSVANTTIGAIVGALPPLIGWAAAVGGHDQTTQAAKACNETGAWSLFSLLFLWQIPHFHALAVRLRADYSAASLRMLACVNPAANALWAQRATVALFPVGIALHAAGVANEPFLWQYSLLTAWFYREASRLREAPTCTATATRLFRASIWHLPLSLGLLLINLVPAPQTATAAQSATTTQHARHYGDNENVVRLHRPWEDIAPFPFLPVPRGPPAIVMDMDDVK